MTGLAAGLLLATAASVAQSSGFLIQHLDLKGRPRITVRHPWRTIRSTFGSRRWLVGLGFGGVGFALHVGALDIAPLSLVQAFLAGGLALAAPLAAFVFGHPLTRAERNSVFVMAAALALLAIGISHPSGHGFDKVALAVYLGSLLATASIVTATVRGPIRFAALALAAGGFTGVLDTSIKAMTELLHSGGAGAIMRSPWWALAVASGLAGFLCFQRALQSGRGLTAIALMEAGAVSTSIVAGFVAFGDSIGSGWLAGAHAVAFIAVGFAAWSLAPASKRLSEASAKQNREESRPAGDDASPARVVWQPQP